MKILSWAVLVLSGAISSAFCDEPFSAVQSQLRQMRGQNPAVLTQEQVIRANQTQTEKREFLESLGETYEVRLEPRPVGRCPCEKYAVSQDGRHVGEIEIRGTNDLGKEQLKFRIEQELQQLLARNNLPSSGIKWVFVQKDAEMIMGANQVFRMESPGQSTLQLPAREDNCGMKNPKFDSTQGQTINWRSTEIEKVVVSHDGPEMLFVNVLDRATGKFTFLTIFRGCLAAMN